MVTVVGNVCASVVFWWRLHVKAVKLGYLSFRGSVFLVGGAYIDLCPRGGAGVAEQPLEEGPPPTGAVNVQQLVQVQLRLVSLPTTGAPRSL